MCALLSVCFGCYLENTIKWWNTSNEYSSTEMYFVSFMISSFFSQSGFQGEPFRGSSCSCLLTRLNFCSLSCLQLPFQNFIFSDFVSVFQNQDEYAFIGRRIFFYIELMAVCRIHTLVYIVVKGYNWLFLH